MAAGEPRTVACLPSMRRPQHFPTSGTERFRPKAGIRACRLIRKIERIAFP